MRCILFAPSAEDTSYCNNEPAPILQASGESGAQIGWYNAAMPGSLLGTGATFQVPF
ncbi:MAG: hypothetical protein R2850_06315 [Bacteroidia bacterium]